MKVSIIVPVYNVEKYINRCVDSLLDQTYSDFEIILIDDGSTDQSGLICDEYAKKDSRVRVLHQKNSGVSVARNNGLQNAAGNYLAFCDSDDYCQKEWLGNLVTVMEDSDVDLVMSAYWYVDENGKKLSKRKRFGGNWSIGAKDQKNRYYLNHVLDKKGEWNGWELWTSLFKNEIVKNNNIEICETSENFAEDLGFLLEYLLYAESVECIETASYCYVQHNGSMMATSLEKVKLNSLNEISKHFGQHYLTLYPENNNTMFPVLHYLILNDQYEKIWYGEDTKRLPAEIGKIADKKWYQTWNRALNRNRKSMVRVFGKRRGGAYLLWNRYCVHNRWKQFAVESALFYKLVK